MAISRAGSEVSLTGSGRTASDAARPWSTGVLGDIGPS